MHSNLSPRSCNECWSKNRSVLRKRVTVIVHQAGLDVVFETIHKWQVDTYKVSTCPSFYWTRRCLLCPQLEFPLIMGDQPAKDKSFAKKSKPCRMGAVLHYSLVDTYQISTLLDQRYGGNAAHCCLDIALLD